MDLISSVLQQCPLFENIPEACTLFSDKAPIPFHKNDVIYDRVHYQKAVGILIDGKAVAMPLGDSKAVLNRFKAGAVFGVAALFSNEEDYISRIIAASECAVLFITEAELKNAVTLYPDLAFNMMAFLADRIRFLNGKLAILSQDNAAAKVYTYILDRCDDEGLTEKINISRAAKDLSLGRTSIYRVLEHLEQNKMIIRKGKQIQVL